MYDELIKGLREDMEWAEANEWETPIMLFDHLKQAADVIEDLENKLNLWRQDKISRWIPVTERLPYESVFVHGKGGELVVAQYSHKHKWWEDDEGYYCDTNYVTHWMPLPEPPKEERV